MASATSKFNIEFNWKTLLNFPDVPVFTTLPHSDNVDLEQNVMLYCDAEGSPTPRIQWFQNTTDGQTIQLAEARNLSINVDYSSQGKYWCRASNTINNNENIVLSDAVEVFVEGNYSFIVTRTPIYMKYIANLPLRATSNRDDLSLQLFLNYLPCRKASVRSIHCKWTTCRHNRRQIGSSYSFCNILQSAFFNELLLETRKASFR